MTSKYLFDTYAIIEILKGRPSYSLFVDSECVINNFIFAELCYNLFLIKEHNAKDYINKYSKFISSVNPDWIKEAMELYLEEQPEKYKELELQEPPIFSIVEVIKDAKTTSVVR